MGFEVQGAKGTANERSRIYGSDGNTIWRHDDRNDPNPYQVEHDVLFDSIKNGIHHNDTEWGAKSSLTTIMGRMAMHSGQEMHLEEVIKSNRSILPEQFSWDASMPDVPDQSGNYPIPLPGITEVL
jgi:hypothetical protein